MQGSDLAKNAMWALWGVHLTNRLMARHGQNCELGISGINSENPTWVKHPIAPAKYFSLNLIR
jgi:hypothetical protein